MNSYNYSLRQRRQGDCRVTKKKKEKKEKELSPFSLFMRCGTTWQKKNKTNPFNSLKQLVIRIFLNEMRKAAKNVHFVVINVSLEQGSSTLFVSRIPQGICPLHAKKN